MVGCIGHLSSAHVRDILKRTLQETFPPPLQVHEKYRFPARRSEAAARSVSASRGLPGRIVVISGLQKQLRKRR